MMHNGDVGAGTHLALRRGCAELYCSPLYGLQRCSTGLIVPLMMVIVPITKHMHFFFF